MNIQNWIKSVYVTYIDTPPFFRTEGRPPCSLTFLRHIITIFAIAFQGFMWYIQYKEGKQPPTKMVASGLA